DFEGAPALDQTLPKQLIIAEKPSVAADIARTLGGFTKHAEPFESDRYVLSSAVGHLIEIAMPEEEEVKRGKWTFAHLPAIPSKFALKPIAKSEDPLMFVLKPDREERGPPQDADEARPRQGRPPPRQRLRRRARGRAHLPLHH